MRENDADSRNGLSKLSWNPVLLSDLVEKTVGFQLQRAAAARGNKSTFAKNKLPRAHRGKNSKRAALCSSTEWICANNEIKLVVNTFDAHRGIAIDQTSKPLKR